MKNFNVGFNNGVVITFQNVKDYYVDEEDRDLCVLTKENEWVVFPENGNFSYNCYWESEN